MFSKILIANRGAIAVRIIRTLKKMNIKSVAVYAEADKDSLHVTAADEAFSLGDGAASSTYLNQEKIIEIAGTSGAQAIHPGYGFLSENPTFVERCRKANITFIGPTVENMQAFALKHTARELAEKYSVPLVPGTNVLRDKHTAIQEAKRIGYPVIIKSSAGGGGIGMQVCRDEDELDKAYDSVIRLSKNNFSDERVFLEKYIEHARHIEVQIFGNGLGDAVDFGERDCSLQRRNQKVIEEAPAPNLSDQLRADLHSTARRLLGGINYANAGTVEFILDTRDQNFYFLEVNTRLQVEHGVTEEIFNVDLVELMVEQAYSPIKDIQHRRDQYTLKGHAIQARIYAENPIKDFQPSAGLLSEVDWGTAHGKNTRIDTWISAGVEVSPFFDPMLAKVICWGEDRNKANLNLQSVLTNCSVYGIATNIDYARLLISDKCFNSAEMFTRFLESWEFSSPSIEVLSSGTMTTIQDTPGRIGYWEIGVPPSGPFDNNSFRLGNKLLENKDNAAGLEITVNGPILKFNSTTQVCITGADIEIEVDGIPQDMWSMISIQKGQTLKLGKIENTGARAYLLIKHGIQCPDYLGSKSTFTLGQFGGHCGRALRTGDELRLLPLDFPIDSSSLETKSVDPTLRPRMTNNWVLNVIYGPHGAPDFFTENDIQTFFNSEWEVHYNSSRTGIRLVGPKPEWARETGGEAGMHPSNIHDNAYAFGTVDFTGDMPVILGPDGPSLGGFVCPATVINADLWKLGQLRAGDKIRFNPVSIDDAIALDKKRLEGDPLSHANALLTTLSPQTCVLEKLNLNDIDVVIRPGGDRFLLIEFGDLILDLRLRMYVYALRDYLHEYLNKGIVDLTPGIRSLQVHFNPHELPRSDLMDLISNGLDKIEHLDDLIIPSRIVHIPLSWDDKACHEAVEKYEQSVRSNAPWCPDNIEFIRRINGLPNKEAVKEIVFNANYVVMGLGDVYLGAPVATPYDPRHRLVTTKYNPARTWTAENSVGIGGAYLCVYGMEGPGGYQFIGRTLQMWNRYKSTREFSQPWLLRFFDQIKFYEVSHEELKQIRKDFPNGHYPLKIEDTTFSLKKYEEFLQDEVEDIELFQKQRESAFQDELQRWRDNDQFHFDSTQDIESHDTEIPDDLAIVESPVAGSVWKILAKEGEIVDIGDTLLVLESMKMEIEIHSTIQGRVSQILKTEGSVVSAGQPLIYIEES